MRTLTFLMLLPVLSFISCKENSYNKIKKYIDGIKVIDTHEHQQQQQNYNFDKSLSYFCSDIISAGAKTSFQDAEKTKNFPDSFWTIYGQYVDYGRTTSYYDEWLKGFQKCLGFPKQYIATEDVPALAKQVAEKYKNYPQYFDECFHNANFELMLLDQYWYQSNINIDSVHFALVLRIDSIVQHISDIASSKKISAPGILSLLHKKNSLTISSLDNYLMIVDTIFNIFLQHNVVCLKNAMAYSRSIDYDNISYNEAKKIFSKSGSLSDAEKKQLQDFMFHWCIKKSIDYKLPIQIHTGYLAGNNSLLDRGHPMKLLPILINYPNAKFVLFHGGYPWTGEWIALGKEFTNVYNDLVWLPQISRTAAIRTLHELLDAVPYNKICWGGDVSSIIAATGSLELGKEVVATVLAERIDKGWMTMEVAEDVARKIFRENAIDIYHLNTKLGIKK